MSKYPNRSARKKARKEFISNDTFSIELLHRTIAFQDVREKTLKENDKK